MTVTAALAGVWPAANALMPASCSSTYTSGIGTPEAIAISSTTLCSRLRCRSRVSRADAHAAERARHDAAAAAQLQRLVEARQAAARRARRACRTAHAGIAGRERQRSDGGADRAIDDRDHDARTAPGRARRVTATSDRRKPSTSQRVCWRAAAWRAIEIHCSCPAAAVRSGEADLRRFARFGLGDLQQLRRLETEHAGDDAARGTPRAGCCSSSPSRCTPGARTPPCSPSR